jgi:hypothetical protein
MQKEALAPQLLPDLFQDSSATRVSQITPHSGGAAILPLIIVLGSLHISFFIPITHDVGYFVNLKTRDSHLFLSGRNQKIGSCPQLFFPMQI